MAEIVGVAIAPAVQPVRYLRIGRALFDIIVCVVACRASSSDRDALLPALDPDRASLRCGAASASSILTRPRAIFSGGAASRAAGLARHDTIRACVIFPVPTTHWLAGSVINNQSLLCCSTAICFGCDRWGLFIGMQTSRGDIELFDGQAAPVEDRRVAGSDRRSASRLKTLKGAQVVWRAAVPVRCVVRNQSGTGACLEVLDPIPGVFDLVFDGDTSRHPCHVIWRRKNRVGVRFDRQPSTTD
jgi:hypothetical protein